MMITVNTFIANAEERPQLSLESLCCCCWCWCCSFYCRCFKSRNFIQLKLLLPNDNSAHKTSANWPTFQTHRKMRDASVELHLIHHHPLIYSSIHPSTHPPFHPNIIHSTWSFCLQLVFRTFITSSTRKNLRGRGRQATRTMGAIKLRETSSKFSKTEVSFSSAFLGQMPLAWILVFVLYLSSNGFVVSTLFVNSCSLF